MRPFLSVAGVALVLATGVACAGGSTPQASTPPTGSSTATASAPAAAGGTGNSEEVCAAVKKLNTTTSRTITARLKAPIQKLVENDISEKEFTAALEKAVNKSMTDGGKWITSLKEQSSKATDPALAAAIDALATELEPVKTGRGSNDTMTKTVEKSEIDLAPLCGGAAVATGASSPTPVVAPGVGPGTACPVPVAFDTAKDWEPEAVDSKLLSDDHHTLLCEIDAKPAGILGFIRVWSVPEGNLTYALHEAITAYRKPTGLSFHSLKIAGQPAKEVTYTTSSKSPGRAFAVTTADGENIVIDWTGLDEEEHEEGLPAYKLAQKSLTIP